MSTFSTGNTASSTFDLMIVTLSDNLFLFTISVAKSAIAANSIP